VIVDSKYKEGILRYYSDSLWVYRLFSFNNETLSLHCGFWKESTKNRHEAMLIQNMSVITLGEIKKENKILDAGCGIGGSAIYIAKETGANVTGININKHQIELAVKYAKQKGVESLAHFLVKDYEKTDFPDASFDVVYGLESICYSYPKINFLREAFRILKPGGKLIIHDGYVTRRLKDERDKKILDGVVQGFAGKEGIKFNDMSNEIKKAGFIKLKVINKTKEVLPTFIYCDSLFKKYRLFLDFISLLPHPKCKAVKDTQLAIKSIYDGIKIGLFGYYIHYAEKPI
jgi:tocopherol O-methyltransferase